MNFHAMAWYFLIYLVRKVWTTHTFLSKSFQLSEGLSLNFQRIIFYLSRWWSNFYFCSILLQTMNILFSHCHSFSPMLQCKVLKENCEKLISPYPISILSLYFRYQLKFVDRSCLLQGHFLKCCIIVVDSLEN